MSGLEKALNEYLKAQSGELLELFETNRAKPEERLQAICEEQLAYIRVLEGKLGLPARKFDKVKAKAKNMSKSRKNEMKHRTMKVSSMIQFQQQQNESKDVVKYEGNLEKLKKKSGFGGGKKYQKRYFLLDSSKNTLNYYESASERLRKPKGTIRLHEILRLRMDPDAVFEITTNIANSKKVRTFKLRADSVADMEDWVNNLMKACPNAQKTDARTAKTTVAAASGEEADVVPVSLEGVDAVINTRRKKPRRLSRFSVTQNSTMEGKLKKRSPNLLKSWQTRYFVLDFQTGLLSYFASKQASKVGSEKGIIVCRDIKQIQAVPKHPAEFKIQCVDKTYTLSVIGDASEADAWKVAILRCKEMPTRQEVLAKKQLDEKARTLALVSTTREIVHTIMEFSDEKTLAQMASVCKDWYRYSTRIKQSRLPAEEQSSSEDESSDEDEDDSEGDMMPVVLDHGAYTIKLGLSANEEGEAVYLPSTVVRSPEFEKNGVLWNFPLEEDSKDWDKVEAAWVDVFKKAKLKPKGHPVIVTTHPQAPEFQKQMIQTILFEKLNVPAVYLTTSPVLVAYAYGVFTGLVVDMGYTSVRVVPIVNGFMIEKGILEARHLSGDKLDKALMKMLTKSHPDKFGIMAGDKLHDLAMSFRRKAVVVPPTYEEGLASAEYKRKVSVDINADLVNVKVHLHKELVDISQAYFDPQAILQDKDASVIGIPDLINNSIAACDVDVRFDLFANILLAGASSNVKGLGDRIEEELKIISPHSATFIHVSEDPNRKHAVWSGGSILTTIEAFHEKWKASWEWEQENGRGDFSELDSDFDSEAEC